MFGSKCSRCAVLRAIEQIVERQFVERDDIGDAPACLRLLAAFALCMALALIRQSRTVFVLASWGQSFS